MEKFYWLNEDSRTFLSRGYLSKGETAEERIRVIADKAEWYLKDMAKTDAAKNKYDGFADKFYEYMSRGYYSLASPVWANYGKKRGLPVSCFGSFVDDNMESILYGVAENGMLMKNGGGCSGYFGAVRHRGAPITDSGESSGSVHFMQMYDTLASVVSQGSVRRGFFAAYTDIDHPDADEFLDQPRLRGIVKKYSDDIGFPMLIHKDDKTETLNAASSLWTRPKKDITPDQYKEFYHHVGHTFDDPWLILHNVVEGVLSYTSLLFVPSTPPFDLFHPDRKSHVKLYVKRVFITDDCEGLLPSYLRFLRGVVDSEDLPLNISRETFQHDPRLAKMRAGLVKRVLDELAKKSEKASEEYDSFWTNFGAVLKEGVYEDFENRERILGLCRFRSTAGEGLASLDTYVERMKEGQDAIYFISGEQAETLGRSPQLEGFKAKGVEVLLMTDPIDEFWIPVVGAYKEKHFKSAAGAGADLGKIAGGEEKEKTEEAKPEDTARLDNLLAALKGALGDIVKDVRVSERLTDSPVCLVAGEGDMDMYLERMLKQHRQLDPSMLTPRILEVNADHPLIKQLAALATEGDGAGDALSDAAHLLFDQARIIEGETVNDPIAFSRRLASVMEKGLAAWRQPAT